jgi:hypothetical protein
MLKITLKDGSIDILEKALFCGYNMLHRKDIVSIEEIGNKTELIRSRIITFNSSLKCYTLCV